MSRSVVGTFSGLRVTKNAMIDTADRYLSEYHMYDDKLVSTLGLEKGDVPAFAALKGVKTAEGRNQPGCNRHGG